MRSSRAFASKWYCVVLTSIQLVTPLHYLHDAPLPARLPKATYDELSGRTVCSRKTYVPLEIRRLPISMSFGVFDSYVLLSLSLSSDGGRMLINGTSQLPGAETQIPYPLRPNSIRRTPPRYNTLNRDGPPNRRLRLSIPAGPRIGRTLELYIGSKKEVECVVEYYLYMYMKRRKSN